MQLHKVEIPTRTWTFQKSWSYHICFLSAFQKGHNENHISQRTDSFSLWVPQHCKSPAPPKEVKELVFTPTELSSQFDVAVQLQTMGSDTCSKSTSSVFCFIMELVHYANSHLDVPLHMLVKADIYWLLRHNLESASHLLQLSYWYSPIITYTGHCKLSLKQLISNW